MTTIKAPLKPLVFASIAAKLTESHEREMKYIFAGYQLLALRDKCAAQGNHSAADSLTACERLIDKARQFSRNGESGYAITIAAEVYHAVRVACPELVGVPATSHPFVRFA